VSSSWFDRPWIIGVQSVSTSEEVSRRERPRCGLRQMHDLRPWICWMWKGETPSLPRRKRNNVQVPGKQERRRGQSRSSRHYTTTVPWLPAFSTRRSHSFAPALKSLPPSLSPFQSNTHTLSLSLSFLLSLSNNTVSTHKVTPFNISSSSSQFLTRFVQRPRKRSSSPSIDFLFF
jgi:hypothetical protein